MRVALIADLHGNRIATEAVLREIDRIGVDRTVCLGDVMLLGPEPAATLDLLLDRDIPIVMGNTDAVYLDSPWVDPETEREVVFGAILDWGRSQLSSAQLDAVRAFHPTIPVDLEQGRTLCCCHGSPRSYHEVILSETPLDEVLSMVEGADADVFAGGHTHIAMLRRLPTALFLNPGSVGIPRTVDPANPFGTPGPDAEYAVLTSEATTLSVDVRRVAVDRAAIRAGARSGGYPHPEVWEKMIAP